MDTRADLGYREDEDITFPCDDCGDDVGLVSDPADLVIVLCAACNNGNPIN